MSKHTPDSDPKQQPLCQCCGVDYAEWAYQPWGPDEKPHTSMSFLGSHYRGFPVIKLCDQCKKAIANGTPMELVYRKKRYITDYENIHEVPDYVGDALLWLEEGGAK